MFFLVFFTWIIWTVYERRRRNLAQDAGRSNIATTPLLYLNTSKNIVALILLGDSPFLAFLIAQKPIRIAVEKCQTLLRRCYTIVFVINYEISFLTAKLLIRDLNRIYQARLAIKHKPNEVACFNFDSSQLTDDYWRKPYEFSSLKVRNSKYHRISTNPRMLNISFNILETLRRGCFGILLETKFALKGIDFENFNA